MTCRTWASFKPTASKTCSNCGNVNAKLKREPTRQCSDCNTVHDRNENAAVNLRELLTLPADSGMTLRNGKVLAVGLTSSETSPDERRTATTSARATLTVDECLC